MAIVNWEESDHTYTINEEVCANPGFLYEVVMSDSVPIIKLKHTAIAEPGQLRLMNKTNRKLNLDVSVSNKLIVVHM